MIDLSTESARGSSDSSKAADVWVRRKDCKIESTRGLNRSRAEPHRVLEFELERDIRRGMRLSRAVVSTCFVATSTAFTLRCGSGSDDVTISDRDARSRDDGSFVVDGAIPPVDPDPDSGTNASVPVGSTDAGALPVTCTGKKGTGGDRTISVQSGGRSREAIVHVPASYDSTLGTALVLNVHGFINNASEEVVLSRMNKIADEKNVIVVYPNGISRSWNAGDCCGTAQTSAVDDVGFMRDLLDELDDTFCVDPHRVYAAGFSNGGFLAYRLACEMSETFAAIGSVSGVLGLDDSACHPKRNVPIMHFHGTSDFVVPYKGGTPFLPSGIAGPVSFRSVASTMTFFRAQESCTSSGSNVFKSGDVSCESYGPCSGGSDITLCTIDGGGHTWPGGFPLVVTGKTTNDISASRSLVDFFLAHPMP